MRSPFQHVPRLVVTDVPGRKPVTKDLLARAGYTFGEDHYVTKVTRESPPDLVARIRAGQGGRISYQVLIQQAEPAPVVGHEGFATGESLVEGSQ